jgi:hypothetical protein
MVECCNCGRDAVGRFCTICARALRDAAQPADARGASRPMTDAERRMVAEILRDEARRIGGRSSPVETLRALADQIQTGEVG